jgi:hypothetical protein
VRSWDTTGYGASLAGENIAKVNIAFLRTVVAPSALVTAAGRSFTA